MKKLFKKPTVFLILGVILILIGIPSGIYGYTLSGGVNGIKYSIKRINYPF